jgi:hypothetical protein
MLERAARPLFLHDDDCDGVSCFVMCYQFCKEGKGVCVKQSPVLTKSYVRKVEEYQPDLVVILDKPEVEEGFFESVRTPILWIDHHQPRTELTKRYGNVTYLNPRIWDDTDNRPTSYWTHKITQVNLWIATVGSVGDWHLPDYLEQFKEKYPHLLPKKYATVEDLYLDTPLGKLIQIIQFNLKGTTEEVRRSILTLARIEHPDEILLQTTSKGKFLYRKYAKLSAEYDAHIRKAKAAARGPGGVLLYAYDHINQTFTAELSNELLIRYPEKVILVCRRHDGKCKCSARSKAIELPSKVERALAGLDGRGGGHTNACGIVVAQKDWDEFYRRFSDLVERDPARVPRGG